MGLPRWRRLIAVVGTLLGASLTYVFQQRSAGRARAVAFTKELRAERLAAYSEFVTAVTVFRRVSPLRLPAVCLRGVFGPMTAIEPRGTHLTSRR